MSPTENTMTDTTYNGWKNYETWNVALWIQNDEFLYGMARDCRRNFNPYVDFVDCLYELGTISRETPDGVRWTDRNVDVEEINEMIEEL